MSPGHTIVGGSTSATTTFSEQKLACFASIPSTATKDTTVVPTLKADPLCGPLLFRPTYCAQLSVNEALLYVTMALHAPKLAFTATSAGQLSCGAYASITLTLKLQLALRETTSVTTNVCVVVPTLNTDPEASPAVCAVVGTLHAWLPTGAVKLTLALHCSPLLFTTIFAGQLMVGRLPSNTATKKLQLAELPLASLAMYVTVVFPTLKLSPLAGPDTSTSDDTLQLSLANGSV